MEKTSTHVNIDDYRDSDGNVEWNSFNKAQQKVWQHNYYVRNKDKVRKRVKRYHEINKDAINERHRAYYENNKEAKEAKLQYCKTYYDDNYDRLKLDRATIIKCHCGSTITKHNLAKHSRSSVHRMKIDQLLKSMQDTIDHNKKTMRAHMKQFLKLGS